jgi:hypothetical protein
MMAGADAQKIKEQGCDLVFGRKVRSLPIENGDTRDACCRLGDHHVYLLQPRDVPMLRVLFGFLGRLINSSIDSSLEPQQVWKVRNSPSRAETAEGSTPGLLTFPPIERTGECVTEVIK